MLSVTQRIKQVKQPRGGYINPKEFTALNLNDGINLNDNENIHSSLVGSAVDYLTRLMTGTSVEEAFRIPIMGASYIRDGITANELLWGISGLTDESITNACKLAGYDVCYRVGEHAYQPVQNIEPDLDTISNIRLMVSRSIHFFKEYGPVTMVGFTFEGGYTKTVSSGDGDFLTVDTIWDFKVSKNAPKNTHTLQLLMYYLMGSRSIHEEFETISNLGIFNPRLNNVYLLEINKIPKDIIEQVSTEVIGY